MEVKDILVVDSKNVMQSSKYNNKSVIAGRAGRGRLYRGGAHSVSAEPLHQKCLYKNLYILDDNSVLSIVNFVPYLCRDGERKYLVLEGNTNSKR